MKVRLRPMIFPVQPRLNLDFRFSGMISTLEGNDFDEIVLDFYDIKIDLIESYYIDTYSDCFLHLELKYKTGMLINLFVAFEIV